MPTLIEPESPSRDDGAESDPAAGSDPSPEPDTASDGPAPPDGGHPVAWLERGITLVIVAAATLFTLAQLQPDLLVADTTPTGGDMGAHVWGPAYLRDTLLPQGRLVGWTPDWYAGFPAYQFYMVVPSLAIVALDVLLPYGIAFKLVTVVGIVALPTAAWAFGRLTRLRFPGPALLAAATLPFLFDTEFTIYGGNIASTMAGEFAFSISLALALLYLGVAARGLETGRHRAIAAVLLALTGLCHLIPAFFALAGTAVLLVLPTTRRTTSRADGTVTTAVPSGAGADRAGSPEAVSTGSRLTRVAGERLRWLIPVGVVAGLLSAFWVLPFYARRSFLNDMGWEKIEPWADHSLFSITWWARVGDSLWHEDIRWFVAFALVGAVIAVIERERAGLFLTVLAVGFAVAFVLTPQGRLWNARLLPFYYLSVYLLVGYAAAELSRAVAGQLTRRSERPVEPRRLVLVTVAALALVVVPTQVLDGAGAVGLLGDLAWLSGIVLLGVVAFDLVRTVVPARPERLYAGALAATSLGVTALLLVTVALPLEVLPGGGRTATGGYRWLGWEAAADDLSFVDGWARWNYAGYERKPGNDSGGGYEEYHGIVTTMAEVGEQRGCGRAMWEYESELDRYGTPMALMLLPFWTDGCIGSMEGLYFEASATTPYHFINQSELSAAPSRAQRDLPYPELDVDAGVDHLQLMGVRYYLAFSDEVLAQARQHPDLTEIAESGPWVVFEVADSGLVEPLEHQPAVLAGVGDGGDSWLEPSAEWYVDAEARDVLLASSGPDGWEQVEPGATPERVPLDPVTVSDVEVDDDRISFRVDQVGEPVLVKASYFPNWQADGADGPYRVTPNLMVVVPTAEQVELHFGWTGVDVVAWLLTGLGVVGLLWLVHPLRRLRRRREAGGADAPT